MRLEHEPSGPPLRQRGERGLELEMNLLSRPDDRQRVVIVGDQLVDSSECRIQAGLYSGVPQRRDSTKVVGRLSLGTGGAARKSHRPDLGGRQRQRVLHRR